MNLFGVGSSLINTEDSPIQVSGLAEYGFVTGLSHTLTFGKNGTIFDYVKDGGQGQLFPASRFELDIQINKRHEIVFLYQPLDIRTETKLKKDLNVYDTIFAKDSTIDLRYGFSFYRVSYLYDFIKSDRGSFGAGLSLQIRNADITFISTDGTKGVVTRNVGPVPIVKLKGDYESKKGVWIMGDCDGFYATSKFFNGADFEFTGAIWDLSLKTGITWKNDLKPFMGLRFIGGGAEGTSRNDDTTGDGYTKNWLSTFALTFGVLVK